jgi:hypothetical protein
MKPVAREEILDYVTYTERRDALRPEAMRAKELRRVEVAGHFLFLFENRDTVRYQVHEMLRVERLVREADIQHELDTYNELLGGDGELGCSLLIGIPDEAERDAKLREWVGLLEHVYVELDDGSRVKATWDPRQVGDDRLSSVQYLKFRVGPNAPRAVGIAFPGIEARSELGDATRAALQADLDDT